MSSESRWSHVASLTLVLVLLWWVLSGYPKPLLLGLGAGSVALVVLLSLRLKLIAFRQPDTVWQTLRFLPYGAWLLWAIVKANLDVCRRILNPALPISPAIAWLAASQRHELARVTYANSITLTPGTIAIDVEGEQIEVHALTRAGITSLETGEMDRRVSAAEVRRHA